MSWRTASRRPRSYEAHLARTGSGSISRPSGIGQALEALLERVREHLHPGRAAGVAAAVAARRHHAAGARVRELRAVDLPWHEHRLERVAAAVRAGAARVGHLAPPQVHDRPGRLGGLDVGLAAGDRVVDAAERHAVPGRETAVADRLLVEEEGVAPVARQATPRHHRHADGHPAERVRAAANPGIVAERHRARERAVAARIARGPVSMWPPEVPAGSVGLVMEPSSPTCTSSRS